MANTYKDELELLQSMGFLDRGRNLEALMISDGNVETAANYLLENV